MFRLPADVQDFPDGYPGAAELRAKLRAHWNDEDAFSMAAFVARASEAPNYVDPRLEPPVGDPVPVPWNGFPRALTRWFGSEDDPVARARAEAAADELAQVVHWAVVRDGELRAASALKHQLALYDWLYGLPISQIARPLRAILPGSVLGDELIQYRRQQDEYLEWHPTYRDGKLTRLTFSAEPPDYWFALAEVSPRRVLELYQELISPSITHEDLFFQTDFAVFGFDEDTRSAGWFRLQSRSPFTPRRGGYNHLNRYTTTDGIMHLTHRANTLGAEVNLAADASRLLAADGEAATPSPPPEIRRIICGGYGGINRSSDPLIGQAVAGQVKQGRRVTLTDPVGLYISNINLDSLTGPGHEPVGDQARRVVRGSDDPFEPRILRVDIALPEGTPFGLDECRFDSRPLRRGGQIARQTTLQLYANIYPSGGDRTVTPCGDVPCEHPTRPGLYLGQRPGEGCPDASHPLWLNLAPAEPPAPPAPGGAIALGEHRENRLMDPVSHQDDGPDRR